MFSTLFAVIIQCRSDLGPGGGEASWVPSTTGRPYSVGGGYSLSPIKYHQPLLSSWDLLCIFSHTPVPPSCTLRAPT